MSRQFRVHDDVDDHDDDDEDGPTLKEVIAMSCKRIDIGCAVLPKPLLEPDPDVDVNADDLREETEEDDDDDDGVEKDVWKDEGLSRVIDDDDETTVADGGGRDLSTVLTGLHASHLKKKIPTPKSPSASRPTLYAETIMKEFTAIVVEHHLKWAPLCHSLPGPLGHETPSTRVGRYDFSHADAVVDWALERNLKVKGHVLCWHVTTPPWVVEWEADRVREELRRHIFTTVGHYRGRIRVWDVVNEALAPDGSLAPNVFLQKLGPTYIEDCFRWAHEADPTATLLYNDNKVEGMGGPNAAKSEGFYQLMAELTGRKVPIHGCGMQAHFNAAGTGRNRPPTPRMVKEQIRRLGQLGLSVNISEMDVRVSKLPPNLRQVAQRQIYHDILCAALTEPAFDGVWLWGFTDRHTWVTHFYSDDEPLIYDDDYGRKQAYYSLRDALMTMAVGGTVGGNVVLDSDVEEDGVTPWGHAWMQPELTTMASPSSDIQKDEGPAGLVRMTQSAQPDWFHDSHHELT